MEALVKSLGEHATLLQHLPFDDVTFVGQGELPWCVPEAIRLGILKRKLRGAVIPQVWIYLDRKAPKLEFHTYHPDGTPLGALKNEEVISKTTLNAEFRFAIDPERLFVLATYYFLKKGVRPAYTFTIPKVYEAILVEICKDFRQEDEDFIPCIMRPGLVKLRVRVPDYICFREAENHEEAAAGDNSEDSVLGETVPDSLETPTEVQPEPQLLATAAARMPDTPPIDRYLDLEDEEITISKDLEASNDRINEVKEQLEHFAKLLKQVEAGATSLHASKDLREAEKKRLWNIMTKGEVRELGRRDVERKRQRVE